jgi:hypothetical protein
MTMSDEEKAAKQQQEAEDKARAVVLRYSEGSLKEGELQVELEAGRQYYEGFDTVLVQQALAQVDMEGDNSNIIELLNKVGGEQAEAAKKQLSSVQQEVQFLKQSSAQDQRTQLAQTGMQGVSETAASPQQDANWQEYLQSKRDELLSSVKGE